ncbi:putative Derlin-2 [Polychytrium aggregatum]|uniref:putative Derlin-2 n=1 Tax=Polychytrium aggregatum TaxID=110093 RepID=UPI0022FDB6BA|nr:putative Derlin-2 [Polychytrium aggregatum]KAI9197222.1 putative Derlin-2 [Polychytrium aggregatum]
MPMVLEEWYYEVPIITRTYLTMVIMTTAACLLKLVSPLWLYFHWEHIYRDREYWRLITSFLFVGEFSVDFFFHMFFLTRYSRMLEEGSFRGRTADYFWMLFLVAVCLIIIHPLMGFGKSIPFLSSPLSFVLVYVWSRRNPYARMGIFGFNFNAPYLPWVMLGLSITLHNVWPWGDLLGLVIGHIYYFLDDVYPNLAPNGQLVVSDPPLRPHYLRAPAFVKIIMAELTRDHRDPHLNPLLGNLNLPVPQPTEQQYPPQPATAPETSPDVSATATTSSARLGDAGLPNEASSSSGPAAGASPSSSSSSSTHGPSTALNPEVASPLVDAH